MNTLEVLRPFERNGSFPIDITSLFYSYAQAVEYAHTDNSAYPGQIISVVDADHEKTAIYKLDYDPDKKYRLILTSIAVGNSQTGAFNLLGVVETFADLPTVADNGEMYLVSDENTFYVAVEVEEDVIEWKKLDLSIDVVSETRDGVFSHTVYSTLFNKSGRDGVYFSSGDGNPENNKWIEVEHTSVEAENDNYTLLSIGRVKQIVGSMMTSSIPHVEIEPQTDMDVHVGTLVQPRLKLIYYPELGGMLNRITVLREDNGSILFDTYPEDKDIIFDEDNKCYYYYVQCQDIISQSRQSFKYTVVVYYNQSTDGNMAAGLCSNSVLLNFYEYIEYGTNVSVEHTFLKDGENVVEMEYHPELIDEKVDEIKISIPSNPLTHDLKAVTFVNQNDLFAKSLFSDYIEENGKITYKYHVSIGFKSPGKFIFYISEIEH